MSPNFGTQGAIGLVAFDAPVIDFMETLQAQVSISSRNVCFEEENIISLDGIRKRLRSFSFRVLYKVDGDYQSVRHKPQSTDWDLYKKNGQITCTKDSVNLKTLKCALQIFGNKLKDGTEKCNDVSLIQQLRHTITFVNSLFDVYCESNETCDIIDYKSFDDLVYHVDDIPDTYIAMLCVDCLEVHMLSKLSSYPIYSGNVTLTGNQCTLTIPSTFLHVSFIEFNSSKLYFMLEWLKYSFARTRTYSALEILCGDEMWINKVVGEATMLLQNLEYEALNISFDETPVAVNETRRGIGCNS